MTRFQIAAEADGNGNILQRFAYGSNANIPDFLINAKGTFRIVSDHLGSPRALVDITTGKVTKRFKFDEFGNSRADSDDYVIPFGFAGGLTDADTGLIHFGARDYDPTMGRFLTKDPIGFGGGQSNLYTYCGNDPVNCTDPTGLWGIFGNYGAQVTAPGGGASATAGVFVGSNSSGGVTAGVNSSVNVSAASAGFSVGQGPGAGFFTGTSEQFLSDSSININLPFVSVTVLMNDGNFSGLGVSTRSVGVGLQYFGPDSSVVGASPSLRTNPSCSMH